MILIAIIQSPANPVPADQQDNNLLKGAGLQEALVAKLVRLG